MKLGYSLIELTIGIFLASMLAISLFQSVRSTTTTVELADDVMDLDIRVANFHHQFARDTIGIFVPSSFAEQPADREKSPVPTKPGEKPAQPPQEEKPATQGKPVKFPDKLFYGVNTDEGRVAEFTFITSNPVRVYEKSTNVAVKPRMVRVMYRLLADPNHADSFTLFRQETDELESSAVDPKAAKPIRGYALLSNIKKMSFDYSYPLKQDESKQEDKEPSQSLQPKVEKIVTRGDWPFKTAQEAQEKKLPPYPQIITAKFELWDNARKSEREFVLNYPIASFTLFEKKKKKTKQPPKQAPKPQENNKERINLTLTLKPKTEERLAQLGQKVFQVTLEGKAKPSTLSAVEEDDLLAKLERLMKQEKSAS